MIFSIKIIIIALLICVVSGAHIANNNNDDNDDTHTEETNTTEDIETTETIEAIESAAHITINTDCVSLCSNNDDNNNKNIGHYNADTNITETIEAIEKMTVIDISNSSEPLVKVFRIEFKSLGTNSCLLVEDTANNNAQEVYGPDEETCKEFFADTEFEIAGELTNPLEITREYKAQTGKSDHLLTFTATNKRSQQTTQLSFTITEIAGQNAKININKATNIWRQRTVYPATNSLINLGNTEEDCSNVSTVSTSSSPINPIQIVTQEKNQNSGVSQREAYITIIRKPIYGRISIPFRDHIIQSSKFPQISPEFIPQTIIQQNPSYDSQFTQQLLQEPFPNFPQISPQFIPQTVTEVQKNPVNDVSVGQQQQLTGNQFEPDIEQFVEQNPSYGPQTTQRFRYVIQTTRKTYAPIIKQYIQQQYPYFGSEQQQQQQQQQSNQQQYPFYGSEQQVLPQQPLIDSGFGQQYTQSRDQNEQLFPYNSQTVQQIPSQQQRYSQQYFSRRQQISSPISVQTSGYTVETPVGQSSPAKSYFQFPLNGQQYSVPPNQGSSNYKRCCVLTVTV